MLYFQSDYDSPGYVPRARRVQSAKKRIVPKKKSHDEGGTFIRRNVTKDKRGSRYHKVV